MNELLDFSPPLALAAALNLLGIALKKSPIANWLIPLLLPVIGAGVYPLISQPLHYQCAHPIVLMAIYGFVIGSGSVGLNQIVRQLAGIKKSGDTALLEKKDIKP